jgi:hypothetical protein
LEGVDSLRRFRCHVMQDRSYLTYGVCLPLWEHITFSLDNSHLLSDPIHLISEMGQAISLEFGVIGSIDSPIHDKGIVRNCGDLLIHQFERAFGSLGILSGLLINRIRCCIRRADGSSH